MLFRICCGLCRLTFDYPRLDVVYTVLSICIDVLYILYRLDINVFDMMSTCCLNVFTYCLHVVLQIAYTLVVWWLYSFLWFYSVFVWGVWALYCVCVTFTLCLYSCFVFWLTCKAWGTFWEHVGRFTLHSDVFRRIWAPGVSTSDSPCPASYLYKV